MAINWSTLFSIASSRPSIPLPVGRCYAHYKPVGVAVIVAVVVLGAGDPLDLTSVLLEYCQLLSWSVVYQAPDCHQELPPHIDPNRVFAIRHGEGDIFSITNCF